MTRIEKNEIFARFMGYKVSRIGTNSLMYADSDVMEPELYSPDMNWVELLGTWHKIIHQYNRGRWFEPLWNRFHAGIDRVDIKTCYDAVLETILILEKH